MGLGCIELGVGPLGVSVAVSFLVNAADDFNGADIEGILAAEIAWMGGFYLAAGYIILFFSLESESGLR